MAATSVTRKFAGLSGRDDLSGRREYTIQYVVETDNANDGASIVKNADVGGVRVDRYGDYYRTDTESDTQAFVSDRQADRLSDESSKLWLVTVTFSTEASSGVIAPGVGIVYPQPEDANPDYSWDFIDTKRAAYVAFDENDNPYPATNSAGDFYDPPFEYDFSYLVLRLTVNQMDYDPLVAALYANRVNSDQWYGFAPGCVLCKPIKGKLAVEKGIGFWKVSYEFHFSFDGWLESVWDAGLREYIPKKDLAQANAERPKGTPEIKAGYQHLKDDHGTFVTEPQLLNGRGRRLIPPGGVLDLKSKERIPYINRFRFHRQIAFGPLQLV